jgi:hypothetical protein
MSDTGLVMPDLVGIRRSVRHGIDSAVLSLLRIGIDLGRIVLESAGPGEPAGTVVSQTPAPGAVLTPVSRVVLRVGGSGALDLMPFPLRDESDTELRGDRLFAIFDNPALKLGFYLRHGGAYLALHADEPITARRWLEDLFLISVDPWPAARWHALARLVPRLHALAGTTSAVRIAMVALFDLAVAEVRVTQGVIPLDGGGAIRLGERGGRLGFDAVLGTGLVGDAHVAITFGPVSLDTWRRHFTSELTAQRRALYPLLLPAHLSMSVSERWRVGNAATGATLGDEAAPALLGVNAYLGTLPDRRAA